MFCGEYESVAMCWEDIRDGAESVDAPWSLACFVLRGFCPVVTFPSVNEKDDIHKPVYGADSVSGHGGIAIDGLSCQNRLWVLAPVWGYLLGLVRPLFWTRKSLEHGNS